VLASLFDFGFASLNVLGQPLACYRSLQSPRPPAPNIIWAGWRIRGWTEKNGNPSKINPEKVKYCSSPKTDHQLASFHQQSTTTSPPKNHIQPPVFAKTPSKNPVPPPQKLSKKFSRDFPGKRLDGLAVP
jgi:hypothetical protein